MARTMARRFMFGAAMICAAGLMRPAQAALVYPTASGVSRVQVSLVVTTLPNGNQLYTTTDRVTNNNPFLVVGIYEVVTGRSINGVAAQWDNAAQLWRQGGLTTRAVNASLSIAMDRGVTDLPIVAGSGVTTASSLSAFLVGSLAGGASATVVRQYEASPGVTSINSTIGLVSTVPEPSSLALCGMALAGLGAWARRRRGATARPARDP